MESISTNSTTASPKHATRQKKSPAPVLAAGAGLVEPTLIYETVKLADFVSFCSPFSFIMMTSILYLPGGKPAAGGVKVKVAGAATRQLDRILGSFFAWGIFNDQASLYLNFAYRIPNRSDGIDRVVGRERTRLSCGGFVLAKLQAADIGRGSTETTGTSQKH